MIYAIDILLIYASYRDIKTLEVPLWITPVCLALWSLDLLCLGDLFTFQVCLLTGTGLFLLLFLFSVISDLGGADCLIAAVVGYCLGIYGLYAVTLAFFLCIPAAAYMQTRKGKKQYPFVPFLAVGMFCVQVWLQVQQFTNMEVVI